MRNIIFGTGQGLAVTLNAFRTNHGTCEDQLESTVPLTLNRSPIQTDLRLVLTLVFLIYVMIEKKLYVYCLKSQNELEFASVLQYFSSLSSRIPSDTNGIAYKQGGSFLLVLDKELSERTRIVSLYYTRPLKMFLVTEKVGLVNSKSTFNNFNVIANNSSIQVFNWF